jgi:hypothetical protein
LAQTESRENGLRANMDEMTTLAHQMIAIARRGALRPDPQSGWLEPPPASPPAEALPSPTSGAEGGGEAFAALKRINALADSGFTPPEGAEARIAWIEAELEDEPNRPVYGDGSVEPRRNGHEVSELIVEHAGLVSRAALAKPASEPAGGGVVAASLIRAADKSELVNHGVVGKDTLRAAADYITAASEALRKIKRTADMSAAIMDDPKRTGAWEGAEKVAEQFRSISERAALSAPASSSPAEAEALPAGVEAVREAWSFLQDRLLEFEQEIGSGEEEREWAGHVHPALVRFNRLIQTLSSAPAQGDGSTSAGLSHGGSTPPLPHRE